MFPLQDEQEEISLRVGDVVEGTVDGIRCDATAVTFLSSVHIGLIDCNTHTTAAGLCRCSRMQGSATSFALLILIGLV
jgi:hypothetical protein